MAADGDMNHPFLIGGGEMGELTRRHPWHATPLGDPATWPDALAMSLSICLGSRFPIVLWWGPEYVMLYNDAWRPILGESKHPEGLGSPGEAVWPEIWDIIGPQLDSVCRTGIATWSEDLLLPLDRYGYLEEAYFTYSYSPIRHVDGRIGGVFSAVSETTDRVLGERRLRTLRDLAEHTAEAKSVQAACDGFAAALGAGNPDLPFCLLFLTEGRAARLVSATNSPPLLECDRLIALDDPRDPWGVARAIRDGASIELPNIGAQRPGLPGGVWPEHTRAAVALPVARSGQSQETIGALVVGINPRRAFDDAYRGFLGLVAGHLATVVANARAHEEERRRVEAMAELDRAKTQFFSNVSHEFRTPLTLMLGPLEDALAAPPGTSPESQHARVELAHRNARRLLKLVNSLLDVSRIEAGRLQAHVEPTELGTFTAELASSFRAAVERAGMALVVDCPPLDGLVPVDRDMWEKVVLNLLSNAFKFTFEGAIGVTLRRVGEMVELAVRDTGTGIPAHETPHLFERFHRVQGARGRTFEGSGIGLALVRELLRLHGGAISVDSEPGRGSLFTASLPVGKMYRAATPDAPARPVTDTDRVRAFAEEALRWLPDGVAQEVAVTDHSATKFAVAPEDAGARILLADDNGDMRDYVRRLLTERGYAVDAVADGQAALAAARSRRPDLVLSDMMMPNLDGLGLLRALRDDPAWRDVPVILLSARAGQDATAEGLDGGADDYLVKPFAARELLARVGAHLAMARVRREATMAARLRAAELEALFQAVPVALWFTRDADARSVRGNHAATRLLRMADAASTSHSAADLDRPTHFAIYRDGAPVAPDELPIRRAARGVPTESEELEIRFDDGTSSTVLCRALPITSPSGEAAGAVASVVDITERKQAELALRRSHGALETTVQERTRELQRIFELSRDLFGTAGFDGYLKVVNPAWSTTLGHDEQTLLGRPFHDFIHADDHDAVDAVLSALRRGDDVRGFEDRLICANGAIRWVSWTAVPEGETFYIVGRDVTHEKAAVDEIAAANRQLLAQIEERERIEDTLRQMQRLEAIGQLTSGVAHDFNNLLTVVVGNIEFLARSAAIAGDEKLSRRLEMMRSAATRGAKLTGQLLAFSRRQRLDAAPVDLNDAVLGMHEMLQTTMGGSVHVETALHRDLAPALVDATQLELVILNLAINARDAMPRGGRLVIETARARLDPPVRAEEPAAGEYVMVAVTDTGTGMTDEVLARMFEPFFTTKEVGRGSGLGLAQVFGFAKQSGGGLQVRSRLGEGTSVRVFLPPAARTATGAGQAVAQESAARPARSEATVLLVDDDPAVREVTTHMLESMGHTVLGAGSGGAALDLLADRPDIDVLVADYAMPGMTGLELARLATQRRPGIPIVFVTGYVDPAALAQVGPERVVRKPFQPDELAAALDAATAAARA